ncbi:MAG: hypothetical protein B7Y99_00175 [Caulobacterales bacterium 32-69-10]|nr:MAG: hypothetical protein B7Y99_00175 [Caulobacterales bacterium 32-69-10]
MNPAEFEAIGRATGIYDFMWLRYSWPAMESLHFISLAVLLGSIGLFDLRLVGFAKGIPVRTVHRLIPFGVAAYVANICTGSLFFLTFPDQYLYNPAFQTKLCFMAVAGLNVLLFYSTVARRALAAGPGEDVPPAARVMGVVSLGAWLCVIACGRLITMHRPPEHWCFWC